jgi:molecular chaperone HtpG
MLQHDRQLKVIAKAIEKKIKNELAKMMESEREKYEKLFDAFGLQLKYGVYSDYGMHRDVLEDLLMFRSSNDGKYVSLKEYTDAMSDEQKFIYYASGESRERIEMLPQVESVKSRGFEVLYLTDDIDEFALKVLGKYADKEFKNVTAEAQDFSNDDEKAALESENESFADMLSAMRESIGSVSGVKFTNALTRHPVCLSSEGELSVEMEKVLKKMPGSNGMAPSANVIMEINRTHPITQKLKALYESDREMLGKYAKILYAEACLISGVSLDNPTELCELVSELMI